MRNRQVCPEALDELSPLDPRAQRSRRDLRRVHRAMLSVYLLKHAWSRLRLIQTPARIIELGAGDGTLLLRLAEALQPTRFDVQLVLLDRQQLVSAQTIERFGRVGWTVKVECKDALEWAGESNTHSYDLCIATLFLHHFRAAELALLLEGVAARSRAFIALEPHRGILATVGSHLIGMLGVNAVTREDAIKSVAAGFSATEITDAWPVHGDSWWTREFRALPFSQCFLAARQTTRSTPPLA
jgi:SAM-dependent methyltransferase